MGRQILSIDAVDDRKMNSPAKTSHDLLHFSCGGTDSVLSRKMSNFVARSACVISGKNC